MAASVEFLPITSLAGTEVPYLRRNQPTTTSVISMNPADKARLVRYEERWRMYQGIQWSYSRDNGDPLITANIAKTIIHKLAAWLVGKGMELNTTEALSEITLPVLREVWKANDEHVLLHEMAVSSGVTGDGFVLVTYQEPTSLERVVDPHGRGKIRIRLLPSHQVFPQWDPRNMKRLRAVKIISEEADNRMPDITPQHGAIVDGPNAHGRQIRRYVETITPDTITEGYDDEIPVSRPNELGEVPLIHWPNVAFPGEYYGMSDLDGIIDLQKELNQKLTNVSDIVNIHASPITIITGAKVAAVERGPRGMWSFTNEKVKVFNLTAPGDMAGIQKYLEFIMQMIYDLSGVPEGSLGRIQAISNTSEVALKIQFGPLIEAITRKEATFIPAIKKINYFILRLYQLITKQSFPTDLCATCGGRILEFPVNGLDGVTRTMKKCFMINMVTLDFMDPQDVRIRVRRQFSFGEATQEMPFWRAKQEFGKKSTSYWDPAPEVDQQKMAEKEQERAEQAQEDAQQQQSDADDVDFERQMALKNGPPDQEQ